MLFAVPMLSLLHVLRVCLCVTRCGSVCLVLEPHKHNRALLCGQRRTLLGRLSGIRVLFVHHVLYAAPFYPRIVLSWSLHVMTMPCLPLCYPIDPIVRLFVTLLTFSLRCVIASNYLVSVFLIRPPGTTLRIATSRSERSAIL